MASTDTTLVIKNPSRSNQHFSISFRLDGTLAELQQLLHDKYDGHPAPADQTLIYGGKVLKDTSARLRDIVSKHDAPEGPHSIHLVVKHKPATVTASPARSVDSSAAASTSVTRAASTVNQTATSTARPVPPPTRTLPIPVASSAAPSGSQPVAAERPAPDAGPAAALHADAGEAYLRNAWGGYPSGPYGAPFAGFPYYPMMRPTTEAAQAATGDGAASAAETAGTPAGSAAATATAMPYAYYNPVIGCAYQAAYSAALAALSVATPVPQGEQKQEQQQQHESVSVPTAAPGGEALGHAEGDGLAPAAPQGQAGTAAAAPPGEAASAAAPQQYAYVPMFVPAYGQMGFPYGYTGQYAFPPPGGRRGGPLADLGGPHQSPLGSQSLDVWLSHVLAAADGAGAGASVDLSALLEALADGGLEGMPGSRRHGGRGQDVAGGQGLGGAGAAAHEAREQHGVLRQRRGRYIVPGALLGGNNDPQAARNRVLAAAAAAAGGRRPRVFTIRISARVLLQLLVFAVVLYQHFTWRRFLALLIGGAVLFITSTWAPFRRLMRGIHAMPPHRVGAAGAAGGAGGAAANGAAGGQQAQGQQQREVRRRGVLQEILVFIVGFITSLLPAWNFNPEDAAAFAAAQELVAAAERAQQQQGAGGEGAAAGEAAQAPAGDGAAAVEAGAARPAGNGARQDGDIEDRQAPAAGAQL